MKSTISDVQKKIKVGTHGEDYGSWMSNPVFYVFGGIALVTLVLTALSFTIFRITVLGVVFAAATVILVALLCWMAWIRRQYAFGKGGMMEKVHQTILSSLDFDGHGSLLDKTTPILIQFHTLKNAANPPFLGGFSIFGTVAAGAEQRSCQGDSLFSMILCNDRKAIVTE